MILPACVVVMAIAAVLFYLGGAEPVTCRWERNPEFPRWETACDDLIAMVNDEHPTAYGFRFCPFCGKQIQMGVSDE